MKGGDNMTGYFKEITNPSQKKYGFPLKEIYKDFGDGTVYGEVDLDSLSGFQKVQTTIAQNYNKALPVI